MARFYGDIKGDRGTVTKTGTPASGIEAHIRGWDVGVRVECASETIIVKGKKKEVDTCKVYRTGGSHNPTTGKLLAVARSK